MQGDRDKSKTDELDLFFLTSVLFLVVAGVAIAFPVNLPVQLGAAWRQLVGTDDESGRRVDRPATPVSTRYHERDIMLSRATRQEALDYAS